MSPYLEDYLQFIVLEVYRKKDQHWHFHLSGATVAICFSLLLLGAAENDLPESPD